MYINESMIYLGLKENQQFPSKDHEFVAKILALGNPLVKSRDSLTEIVQEIISIPIDKIKTITIDELPITKQYFILP